VALNTAGTELRKRHRKDQHVFVPIDEALSDTLREEASDPRVENLYRLIDQLPDDEKKLIYLYLDRLPYIQIASIAGITETAIKQRIYRIKQKLVKLHQQKENGYRGNIQPNIETPRH